MNSFSNLRSIYIVHIDVADQIGAWRNIDDTWVKILGSSRSQLWHQQMRKQKMSQIINSKLALESIFG